MPRRLRDDGLNRYEQDRQRIADGQRDDPPLPFDRVEDFNAIASDRACKGGSPRRKLTARQRKQIRRNCVIKVANMHGISERMLADVFGLSRSVVAEIVKGRQLCGRPRDDPDRDP